MKGNLHITEEGEWIVKYSGSAPYYKGSTGNIKEVIPELPVSPNSLSNPHLSTYWVNGREVEFEEEVLWFQSSGKEHVLARIIHDDSINQEDWEEIKKKIIDENFNLYEFPLIDIGDLFEWFKKNYNPPKRK